MLLSLVVLDSEDDEDVRDVVEELFEAYAKSRTSVLPLVLFAISTFSFSLVMFAKSSNKSSFVLNRRGRGGRKEILA